MLSLCHVLRVGLVVGLFAPPLFALIDNDGDGISDVWSVMHPTAGAAEADPNGDCATNRAEAIAGTDPTSAATNGWLSRHLRMGVECGVSRYVAELAAGRENPSVTDYFIDDHPAVLRLMEIVIQDAATIPVSLCGELAGKLAAIPDLLRIGLRSLRVAASVLSEVRRTIHEATVAVEAVAGR